MAKKENRVKKREQEREAAIKAREARFKKNGYISLGTIVVCTVLMYVVSAKLMGTVLGKNLLIFLAVIVGIAFVWSVVNASIRMREMKQDAEVPWQLPSKNLHLPFLLQSKDGCRNDLRSAHLPPQTLPQRRGQR